MSHCSRAASGSQARRLRASLLSLLGLLPIACGGTTTDDPAPGDPPPSGPSYVGVDSDGRVVCTQTTTDSSGLVFCKEGYGHRPEAGSCPPPPSTDPDVVFCLTDTDCPTAQACVCSPFGGACVDATCMTDADCQSGEVCSPVYPPALPCQFFVMASNLTCDRPVVPGTGGSSSTPPAPTGGGTCGRPFLVQDVPRVAPSSSSAAWTAGQARPAVSQLTLAERQALAKHWTRMGQMEHASIAAFARFSLQLLSLGAPPELVEDCTRALRDETEHAKLCFELASAYAGCAIGPGPLDISNSLDVTTLTDIVDLVLLEGCFGETSAALEALEAAANAHDPVIADAYARIAQDEERHAALAFRFVRWALESEPRTVEQRILEVRRSAPNQHSSARDVVVPCLDALLDLVRVSPAQELFI
jgi:hypothetical protein